MLIVELTFFGCLFLLAYVYVGYPLLVMLLAKIHSRPVRKEMCEPEVTVIIPAYNEEQHIRETIENKLLLAYPAAKLEILVVSDGSTDLTDTIVNEYAHKGVRLLRQEPRAGKTSGLNRAILEARGDIIFFSDANSIHDQGALRSLVANFADPQVGYVTGKMIYVDPDGSIVGDGCSAYMKYENCLRDWETQIGSVVGVDGGVDAVRKHLYRPMGADQLPDFVLPLAVVDQGYRVVYEPKALLQEDTLKEAEDEYRMRVRVSLRALWALYDMRRLFLPGADLLFSWQLWSHKVLRYLCFLFMIGVFLSNLALVGKGQGYALLFILQCVFYLVALLSKKLEKIGMGNRVLYWAYYFVLINLAAGHAFLKFVQREKMVLWSPRKG
jgi:cellulose synthase/poly-beta-1,6-N-acetylglucosamine synthase-like glycosyltransferase